MISWKLLRSSTLNEIVLVFSCFLWQERMNSIYEVGVRGQTWFCPPRYVPISWELQRSQPSNQMFYCFLCWEIVQKYIYKTGSCSHAYPLPTKKSIGIPTLKSNILCSLCQDNVISKYEVSPWGETSWLHFWGVVQPIINKSYMWKYLLQLHVPPLVHDSVRCRYLS